MTYEQEIALSSFAGAMLLVGGEVNCWFEAQSELDGEDLRKKAVKCCDSPP